jgi:hypothetical protein
MPTATPTQWLAPVRVNTSDAPPPGANAAATNAQQNAAVVGLTNGNYLVDWEDYSGNNTGGDTIKAFETSLDRFDLAGGSFSSAVRSGKDTILTHSVSMPVPPVSVSLLSVGQWNALVLPAGGSTSDHHPVALAIDAAYSGRLRPAPSGGHAGFLFV